MVINDNEFKTKDKDKIEPQHVHPKKGTSLGRILPV